MSLSDEDRKRIEEEEMVRAEARIRAEAVVKGRLSAERGQVASRHTGHRFSMRRLGILLGVGALSLILVSIVLLNLPAVITPANDSRSPLERDYAKMIESHDPNTTADFLVDKRDGHLYHHWHPGA